MLLCSPAQHGWWVESQAEVLEPLPSSATIEIYFFTRESLAGRHSPQKVSFCLVCLCCTNLRLWSRRWRLPVTPARCAPCAPRHPLSRRRSPAMSSVCSALVSLWQIVLWSPFAFSHHTKEADLPSSSLPLLQALCWCVLVPSALLFSHRR